MHEDQFLNLLPSTCCGWHNWLACLCLFHVWQPFHTKQVFIDCTTTAIVDASILNMFCRGHAVLVFFLELIFSHDASPYCQAHLLKGCNVHAQYMLINSQYDAVLVIVAAWEWSLHSGCHCCKCISPTGVLLILEMLQFELVMPTTQVP